MTAESLPRDPEDLTELVRAGYDAAVSGEAVALAARRLWEAHGTPDLAAAMAPVGLAAMIHRALAAHRRPPAEDVGEESESDPSRGARRARPFVTVSWAGALASNYEVRDGTRKDVLNFTKDDCLFLAGESRARAVGYNKLADAMDLAASLLTHRLLTVGALSPRQQQRIEEALS